MQKTLFFLCLFSWISFSVKKIGFNPDLVLKFSNLRNKEGKILISIFSSKDGFPEDEKKALKSWVVDPSEKIVLKDIPPGQYALAVLHDEDGNYKMTFNFLHLPKEGFAFSNFKSSILKIPDFDQARFEHKKNGTNLHLKIVY